MHIIQSNTDLRADILAFIAWRRHGVTFAELVRMLPQIKGGDSYYYPGFDCILIWRGLSSEAIAALSALIDEEIVEMTPTSALTYMFFDRYRSNLPIAAARRKYRTLRWWPMTLAMAGKAAGAGADEGEVPQTCDAPLSGTA